MPEQNFDLSRVDQALDEVRANADRGEAPHNPWALQALRAADELRARLVSVLADLDESEELRERMAQSVRAVADLIESFDPATMCHPKPELGGAAGCPQIEPCKLRCHIRWLDGQIQPNDSYANPHRMSDREHDARMDEEMNS